jgi:hypothetical protein
LIFTQSQERAIASLKMFRDNTLESQEAFCSRCFLPRTGTPRSDVPLDLEDQHPDNKWPECVVLDTTHSMLTPRRTLRAASCHEVQTPVTSWSRPGNNPPESFAKIADGPGRILSAAASFAWSEPGRDARPGTRRPTARSFNPVEGRDGLHRQSASQAARKNLTRSRTNEGRSFRRSFASSPIRTRISTGSKIRSMKICAVVTLLF